MKFLLVFLSFTSLQAIIQRMYVGVMDDCLLYAILLCQTDTSDARGGSLTEKFGLASFIVIEIPALVSDSAVFWYLTAQEDGFS